MYLFNIFKKQYNEPDRLFKISFILFILMVITLIIGVTTLYIIKLFNVFMLPLFFYGGIVFAIIGGIGVIGFVIFSIIMIALT